MEKVKIFCGFHDNVEKFVNEWLREKEEAEITRVLQSEQGSASICISIFYMDEE